MEQHTSLILICRHYFQQRRFEDALEKLQADLDSRLLQRQQMSELRIAQDQARAQIELESLNAGSSTLQTGRGDEDGAIDEEEEEAEDEDEEEEELQKGGISLEVGSEGASTTGQYIQ